MFKLNYVAIHFYSFIEKVSTIKIKTSEKMKFDRKILLLMPCCANKNDNPELFSRERTVYDFITNNAKKLLIEGRKKCSKNIVEDSKEISALTRYDGYLYTQDLSFKERIKKEIFENEVHVLILSAGYGVLRPEERIKNYNVRIDETYSCWIKNKLPEVIQDYIIIQKITHVFGVFAKTTSYMKIIRKINWNEICSEENLEFKRIYYPQCFGGGALRKVPTISGKLILRLIDENFNYRKIPNRIGECEIKFLEV